MDEDAAGQLLGREAIDPEGVNELGFDRLPQFATTEQCRIIETDASRNVMPDEPRRNPCSVAIKREVRLAAEIVRHSDRRCCRRLVRETPRPVLYIYPGIAAVRQEEYGRALRRPINKNALHVFRRKDAPIKFAGERPARIREEFRADDTRPPPTPDCRRRRRPAPASRFEERQARRREGERVAGRLSKRRRVRQ